jgi:hypothetical protein
MMRIKGHRIFEKKPKNKKKSSADLELGQSEIENELFEQSLSKSKQASGELFIHGKSQQSLDIKEENQKINFSGKSTLLPEDIQEILFNNNQVYVDKPLKEINKLFRDLKQARKMDKIYKTNEEGKLLSISSKNENKNITNLIDNFADQVESCFNVIQKKPNPDKESIIALKCKLRSFFSELKKATNKTESTPPSIKIKSKMGSEEKEIKSLTHILDGSIENLINQEKLEKSNLGRVSNEVGIGNSIYRYGWGTARVGSLFDKMVVNDRVYNELNNIKKFNFKLKEALSTYQRKKR